MGLRLVIIALVVCLVSASFAQTFQYSRGWTNGKRNILSSKENACEMHRVRAILEGKPLTLYFWPCSYRRYSEPNGRNEDPPAGLTKNLPVDVDETK